MTFLSSCRPTFEAFGSCFWLACLVFGSLANAQTPTWPERPIRIVSPYPAGSAPDNTLRKITPELSKALGQAVIIETRLGAGGRIAATEVAQAAPDGYTFAISDTGTMMMLPMTVAKMPYDAQKDFVPVVRLVVAYPLIAGATNSSVQKLSDLKNLGRTPSFGLAALGGYSHAICATMGKVVGFECNPVPYSKGNMAALIDVASGNIDLSLTYPSEVRGLLDTGKVRLLATFAPKRNPNFPDVPSITEFSTSDTALGAWVSFFAPKGTPSYIVDRLRVETNKVINSESFRTWFEGLGNQVETLDGPAFTKYLDGQRVYLKKIVDTYGLKSE
jgi:tripartite-type tricarboxylate transporter receptor subunit TctC